MEVLDHSHIQICAYNNKTWRAHDLMSNPSNTLTYPKVHIIMHGTDYSSNEEISHFIADGKTQEEKQER